MKMDEPRVGGEPGGGEGGGGDGGGEGGGGLKGGFGGGEGYVHPQGVSGMNGPVETPFAGSSSIYHSPHSFFPTPRLVCFKGYGPLTTTRQRLLSYA